MRKAPMITLGIGIVLILLQEQSTFLGTVGLILFVISMPFIIVDVYRDDKKRIIKDIKEELSKLNFTQEEIEVREKGLQDKSKWELKSIRRDVKAEVKQKERNEFLKR